MSDELEHQYEDFSTSKAMITPNKSCMVSKAALHAIKSSRDYLVPKCVKGNQSVIIILQ